MVITSPHVDSLQPLLVTIKSPRVDSLQPLPCACCEPFAHGLGQALDSLLSKPWP